MSDRSSSRPRATRARKRLASTLAGLVVLLCAAFAAQAAVVEGQVFDREGRPMAGLKVTLIERTGGGLLTQLKLASTPVTDTEVMRVTTDRHGFFTFDTGPRSVRGHVLVRVGDAAAWDPVRYAVPDDKDVTRALRERGRAVVACVVDDAPGWATVAREIARAGGPDSDRGRILRRRGLPAETTVAQDGAVEWRYGQARYVFRDGKLETTPNGPNGPNGPDAPAAQPAPPVEQPAATPADTTGDHSAEGDGK